MGKSKDVHKKGKGKTTTKKPPQSSDESQDEIVVSDSDADEEFVIGSTSPVSSDSEGDSLLSTSQAEGKKKGKIAAAANRGARWSEAEWLALLKESVKHRIVMQEWQTKTNKDAKKSALGDIAREYLFLLLLYKKHISK